MSDTAASDITERVTVTTSTAATTTGAPTAGEAERARTTRGHDIDRRVICLFVMFQNTAVMLAVLLGIIFKLIPPNLDSGLAGLIFAIVNMSGIATGYIYSFYFGSSANSFSKDSTITDLAKRA